MTPKGKALELYSKMYEETPLTGSIIHLNKLKKCAKQCALIAVNEILNVEYFYETIEDIKDILEYWQEVKQEIEKL